MYKILQKKGFTLIELLLVVLILGVLASLVIPRITESSRDAKVVKCDTNVAALNRSIELVGVKTGDHPANQAAFDNDILGSSDFFPHGVPVCPYVATYVYNGTTKSISFHDHSAD